MEDLLHNCVIRSEDEGVSKCEFIAMVWTPYFIMRNVS